MTTDGQHTLNSSPAPKAPALALGRPDKVLVLGDDMRSFLATVRSLGRKGIEVHVAPYDHSSPALQSRYIRRIHSLPFYLDGGEAWLSAMTTLLETEQFSVVIPCDERSLLPLLRHEAQLRTVSALAIPDEQGMDLFFDKHRTRIVSQRLGIPVAHGRLVASDDTVRSIVDEVGLPFILKHRKSYSWPELYVRTKTAIILSEEELADWLRDNPDRGDEILFEQMFPGIGVGVSVLAHQGKILQAFEHHRVRELDGSSYYRKSAPIDPSRLDAVSKLVADSSYTGIGMFEFKVDPTSSEWILLEVNARPWGSLPLPVAAGIDFPYRLYQLLAKGEETPAIDYQPELYGRNLVMDCWQARTVMQSLIRSPLEMLKYLGEWCAEFRHYVLRREFHDGVVADDKRPGQVEIRQAWAGFSAQIAAKLFRRERPLRAGVLGRLSRLLKSAANPIRILVVCDGNICRSPYAALKLQQLLGERGGRFDIRSAGMLPRNRRSSPQVAIDAAARRGIELRDHRSEYAFKPAVDAADLILIFDLVNLKSMKARYPQHIGKVYFVGERIGSPARAVEIADPIGKTAAGFDTTYGEIDKFLQDFADTVRSHPS